MACCSGEDVCFWRIRVLGQAHQERRLCNTTQLPSRSPRFWGFLSSNLGFGSTSDNKKGKGIANNSPRKHLFWQFNPSHRTPIAFLKSNISHLDFSSPHVLRNPPGTDLSSPVLFVQEESETAAKNRNFNTEKGRGYPLDDPLSKFPPRSQGKHCNPWRKPVFGVAKRNPVPWLPGPGLRIGNRSQSGAGIRAGPVGRVRPWFDTGKQRESGRRRMPGCLFGDQQR